VEVQDRCPDTWLANNGCAVDVLIAITLEVVVTKSARVWDAEKMATWMGWEGLETEVVEVLPEGQLQMNTTVEVRIRLF